VEIMMEAGVRFIQLRSKVLSGESLRVEAQAAGKAAEERGAVLVVNDCPSLAADSRASGVHLGMEDGSPGRARELLGESAIIGRTVHSLAEARQVKDEGNCDYVGLGPYRTSQTKRSLDPILGHAEIVEIRSFLDPLPIYLIGGLGLSDIGLIEELGVNGLAVCSALSDGEVFGANLEAFVERANAFVSVRAVS
jgi:thiamine-phosphate pyrophosphorylase